MIATAAAAALYQQIIFCGLLFIFRTIADADGC